LGFVIENPIIWQLKSDGAIGQNTPRNGFQIPKLQNCEIKN
jgi:hypothetical protein